jgi:hypothetical protein
MNRAPLQRKVKWWGYLHVNGTIHTKHYFDRLDIVEAKASDFVKEVYGPFECDGKEQASEIVYNVFHYKSIQTKHEFFE